MIPRPDLDPAVQLDALLPGSISVLLRIELMQHWSAGEELTARAVSRPVSAASLVADTYHNVLTTQL